jgi:hypothetical protein
VSVTVPVLASWHINIIMKLVGLPKPSSPVSF